MTICKLQVSQFSSSGEKTMLIYDEEREIFYQAEATEEVLKLMDGRPKIFVYTELVDTKVQIVNEAPWQHW